MDQGVGFTFCMQFCTQQMEWVALKYIRIIRNLQHKVRRYKFELRYDVSSHIFKYTNCKIVARPSVCPHGTAQLSKERFS